MSLSRIDEQELLLPLYQGASDEGGWLVFLDRLRRRTGAHYVGLLRGRGQGRPEAASEMFVVDRVVTGPAGAWQQAFHRRDPAPHRALRPDRVYGIADFPDETEPSHAGYAADVVAVASIVDQRVVRVTEPGGASWWLMIARRDDSFGASISALLSALAPHLRAALRMSALLGEARWRAEVADAALARLGLGWMAVDGNGGTIASGGQIPAGVPAVGLPLAGKSTRSSRVAGAAGLETHVEARPVEDRAGEVAAIAYLRAAAPDGSGAIDALAQLHGLSALEARLAWALCRGLTIAEAGAAEGLTLETARNYSKRIYAKTGARGHADLVRVILTGVAPFA